MPGVEVGKSTVPDEVRRPEGATVEVDGAATSAARSRGRSRRSPRCLRPH